VARSAIAAFVNAVGALIVKLDAENAFGLQKRRRLVIRRRGIRTSPTIAAEKTQAIDIAKTPVAINQTRRTWRMGKLR
jgi:hypothetical protein